MTENRKKCGATTAAGNLCRAWARPSSGLCIYHDPAYAQALRESGARGGSHIPQLSVAEVSLRDPIGLQAMAEVVLRMQLAGAIPYRQMDRILRTLQFAQANLPQLRRPSLSLFQNENWR